MLALTLMVRLRPISEFFTYIQEDTIVKDLKKELENEKKANHSLKNELLKTREQIKNYSKINILIKELFGLEVADCIEDEDGYRFNCKNTGRRGSKCFKGFRNNFKLTGYYYSTRISALVR